MARHGGDQRERQNKIKKPDRRRLFLVTCRLAAKHNKLPTENSRERFGSEREREKRRSFD